MTQENIILTFRTGRVERTQRGTLILPTDNGSWQVFSGTLEEARDKFDDFSIIAVVERRPTDEDLREINRCNVGLVSKSLKEYGLKALFVKEDDRSDWKAVDFSTAT